MPLKQKNDDFTIHFVALFSERHDAIPILMLHGWPGSFLEFLGVLALLKNRYNPSTLPYHVIIPSLPGWAFSSKPPLHRDFTCNDVAEIMNTFMLNLGFDAYVAQGGDIGSFIARILGATYDECKAVHCMYPPAC